MDRWRSMLTRVIEAQDRLEFGARFDKRSDLQGCEPAQTMCREPKNRIRGSLRRAPRLFGQLPHHAIVTAHEMIRELTAECGEQGARVSAPLAQKARPAV